MLTKSFILKESKPVKEHGRGLYFLIDQDEIVYVGMSSMACFERVATHFEKKQLFKFDNYTIIPLPTTPTTPTETLRILESIYITEFKPRYNIAHNRTRSEEEARILAKANRKKAQVRKGFDKLSKAEQLSIINYHNEE